MDLDPLCITYYYTIVILMHNGVSVCRVIVLRWTNIQQLFNRQLFKQPLFVMSTVQEARA